MHRGSWHYHGRAGPLHGVMSRLVSSRWDQREVRWREAARGLAWPSQLERTLYFSWRGMIWVRHCCFFLKIWQKFSYLAMALCSST
jgi:hypothetical protein